MMSEERSENGRINEHGELEVDSQQSTPVLGSPRQSVTISPDSGSATPPRADSASASAIPARTTPPGLDEPVMEFFEHRGEGEVSGSEGDSPRVHDKEDNVSHHSRSYVTVSPSVSPGEWEGLTGTRCVYVWE